MLSTDDEGFFSSMIINLHVIEATFVRGSLGQDKGDASGKEPLWQDGQATVSRGVHQICDGCVVTDIGMTTFNHMAESLVIRLDIATSRVL